MIRRIEYIDAMRGFTMLLVVLSHVFTFSFGHHNSIISGWFSTFRMPLFFTISGFVLYKPTFEWTVNNVKSFLIKKSKIQLLSTIVFFCLYELLIADDWNLHLHHASKGGYWFTIVLFFFFFFYSITRCIIRRGAVGSKTEDIVILLSGLLFYFLIPFISKPLHIKASTDIFSFTKMNYYLFFCCGTLVRKHYHSFLDFTERNVISAVPIIVSIGLYILQRSFISLQSGHIAVIVRLLMAISGIILCLSWFHKHEELVSQNTKIGKVLQFVGKRTLDIYFIHYFVLPRHLDFIGEWFECHSMPFLYLLVGVIISIIIIGFCLLISSVLRISPFLSQWLFGVKAKQ